MVACSCGQDDDRSRIVHAVEEWTNAWNSHDPERVCELEAKSARDLDAQRRRCVRELRRAGASPQLDQPKVTRVEIKGGSATAHVEQAARLLGPGFSGQLRGPVQPVDIRLSGTWRFIRVDGDWKVRVHPEVTTVR